MSAIAARTGDWLIVALTPVQRWQAARRLDNAFTVQEWIVMGGAIVLVGLIAAFVFVSIRRRAARNNAGGADGFLEQAGRRGLSGREGRVLHYVATLAGLKEHGAVFTMKKAFDLGAAVLVRQAPLSGMNAERVGQLTRELNSLREKLGFQGRSADSAAGAANGSKPSSRTIPEGKALYITRRTNREIDDIEALVIQNTDSGITVKLPMPINSPADEQWRVRYFYGASVWEFDVGVIRNEGDILVLGHSDNIRFINRRRFVRVPVSKRAYLAKFPFEKQVFVDSAGNSLSEGSRPETQVVQPQFTGAVLTELAGPGLRIESPLELQIGERVAVVFELESQQGQESDGRGEGGKPTARVVESIGEVKHVRTVENGFSVAVELTGLSDADVSELTRATNAAAVKAPHDNGRQEQEADISKDAAAAALRS